MPHNIYHKSVNLLKCTKTNSSAKHGIACKSHTHTIYNESRIKSKRIIDNSLYAIYIIKIYIQYNIIRCITRALKSTLYNDLNIHMYHSTPPNPPWHPQNVRPHT